MPSRLLELQFLGTPQLYLRGECLNQQISGRPLALWAYLVVTGVPHARDVLADLLWTDLDNQQARNNLRYLLPELRKMFGEYLSVTTKSISFNRQQPYTLDIEVLRTTLAAPTESINNQRLQAAVDLYRGEFLAGFSVRQAPVFEEWLVIQRSNMRQLAVQGLYMLAERHLAEGNHTDGLSTTQRLLHLEPWHEAGHRLQMHFLAASGQRNAALAHYNTLRQKLIDNLGVEPTAETHLLHIQLSRDEWLPTNTDNQRLTLGSTVTNSAVPLSIPAVRHNLPGQLTTFIGRQEEIADLCTYLLSPDPRLVTLFGEGGIGKTRLALAVAQSILDATAADSEKPQAKSVCSQGGAGAHPEVRTPKYPDGIWFVALAGITVDREEVDGLTIAVAQAIGLQFSGHQALLTQLLTYLRHKALLLIFDNAEHLLPMFTDFLLELLQSCPNLVALVTSRHVLNLQAEFVWRVAGLPVPPTDKIALLPPDSLKEYSSVALFVERVNRINRSFQLTKENQASIVAICHLVAGLPLALELAAALTKRYSYAELYTMLQQTYTILVSNFADLAPRHRSIGAMLDYSWQFLTAEEARILAACSIFAGGFTRTAVMRVLEATPQSLTSLIDQSLLQVNGERFTLHELVRQYADTRLAQEPERRYNALVRHATYYMELLHSLEIALLGQVEAQGVVQNELDNIRAAWRWSIDQGQLALLAFGLESLQAFYRLAGLYREAIHLLEMALSAVRQALSVVPTSQTQQLLARLLCHTAQFYRRVGGVETGEALAQEALQLGQQLADPALLGLAYHELARLAQVRSDFLTMFKLAELGTAHARQAGLPQLTAECLNDLGIAVSSAMHPLTAIPHFYEARQLLQGGSNRYLEARVIGNLGFFHLSCHEYHLAYRYLVQAFDLQCLLQDREGSMITQLFLGDLWTALGLYEQAERDYEQVLTSMQTIHNPYWKSWLHTSYGNLHYLRGNPVAARAAHIQTRQFLQHGKSHVEEQWLLIGLGQALTALHEWEEARHCYQQAIALHKEANWVYHTADAHAGLAALLLAQNEAAEALPHSEAALAILGRQGLAASKEPFRIYWIGVCVLEAHHDPRAMEVLCTASQILQTTAQKLEEEPLRRAFLEGVDVNRQIRAAGQAAGMI